MKSFSLPNATLLGLIASCFIQIGAQLFAVSMIASTLAEAPPRSFSMLQGEHGYNSEAFWNIIPNVTFLLFIIALIANWRTTRRTLLLAAFVLFVGAGCLAIFFLGPTFDAMIARGYSEAIDIQLQSDAKQWLMLDWMVWGVGLSSGVLLLLAMSRNPESSRK